MSNDNRNKIAMFIKRKRQSARSYTEQWVRDTHKHSLSVQVIDSPCPLLDISGILHRTPLLNNDEAVGFHRFNHLSQQMCHLHFVVPLSYLNLVSSLLALVKAHFASYSFPALSLFLFD